MQPLRRTLFALLLTVLVAALTFLLLVFPWALAAGLQQNLKFIPGGMTA